MRRQRKSRERGRKKSGGGWLEEEKEEEEGDMNLKVREPQVSFFSYFFLRHEMKERRRGGRAVGRDTEEGGGRDEEEFGILDKERIKETPSFPLPPPAPLPLPTSPPFHQSAYRSLPILHHPPHTYTHPPSQRFLYNHMALTVSSSNSLPPPLQHRHFCPFPLPFPSLSLPLLASLLSILSFLFLFFISCS